MSNIISLGDYRRRKQETRPLTAQPLSDLALLYARLLNLSSLFVVMSDELEEVKAENALLKHRLDMQKVILTRLLKEKGHDGP